MTGPSLSFRRIVLGLDQSASDGTALRFAADFAKLLRLDLFGLFAEDPGLAQLAGLSSLREFRVLERQWCPIEGRSLSGDLESRAAVARRAFEEMARVIGVSRRFEIVHAKRMDAIAAVSGETDIVMVSESRTAANFCIPSFPEIVAAAMRTRAAVLLVPNPAARSHGPVLAIGATADDPCVASAAAIAAAADEQLEVVTMRDLAVSMPWRRRDQPGERMVVMSRRVSASLAPLSIVSQRRIPVLVLGRGRVAATKTLQSTVSDRER